MARKHLIDLLLNNPVSPELLAKLTRKPVKEVAEDLEHLQKSLKHKGYDLKTIPAMCRQCGFRFDSSRFRTPSKCPECKSTWILEMEVEVVEKEE